ncbi:ATP-grasp domain-containing protein [Candidatus Woesearchaeota archaeon]|nr:ATP-grasp domain-containing protein [Candidatus Woesearchaeota archaeon]
MRVGILYNLIDQVEKGNELDKLADNEVYQTANAVKEALSKKGYEVSMVRIASNVKSLKKQIKSLEGKMDFVFNLAEGVGSDVTEEPRVVRYLKKSGIPFTGCDDYALALCMDKLKTKKELIKNNIPTPEFQLFRKADDKIKASLKFPLIVKPVHEDGSIGITEDSIVYDNKQLKRKVRDVLTNYKQPALVEEYIDGREINVALLGNGKLEALPLSEIIFNFPNGTPKIVSFEAKWIEDSEQYKGTIGKCPADLPQDIQERLSSTAKKAFQVVKCRDYGRVDFRVRGDDVYVLEVNPNPCINPVGAGFIRSANAAGLSYDDVVTRIVEIAYKRHSEK